MLQNGFIGDRRHCGLYDFSNDLDFGAAVRMSAVPTFLYVGSKYDTLFTNKGKGKGKAVP
jgi:hypothetical protein